MIDEPPVRTPSPTFCSISTCSISTPAPATQHNSPRNTSSQPPNAPADTMPHLTSPDHCSRSSVLRSCVLTQKHDPLFSTACALFSIHNFAHPFYFVTAAHSLPKTPGGGVDRSNQTPLVPVTPIESYSFARIAPKPNGILLFHHDPRGRGVPISTFLSRKPAGNTATSRFATSRTPCGTARSFPQMPNPSLQGRTAGLRRA